MEASGYAGGDSLVDSTLETMDSGYLPKLGDSFTSRIRRPQGNRLQLAANIKTTGWAQTLASLFSLKRKAGKLDKRGVALTKLVWLHPTEAG